MCCDIKRVDPRPTPGLSHHFSFFLYKNSRQLQIHNPQRCILYTSFLGNTREPLPGDLLGKIQPAQGRRLMCLSSLSSTQCDVRSCGVHSLGSHVPTAHARAARWKLESDTAAVAAEPWGGRKPDLEPEGLTPAPSPPHRSPVVPPLPVCATFPRLCFSRRDASNRTLLVAADEDFQPQLA